MSEMETRYYSMSLHGKQRVQKEVFIWNFGRDLFGKDVGDIPLGGRNCITVCEFWMKRVTF